MELCPIKLFKAQNLVAWSAVKIKNISTTMTTTLYLNLISLFCIITFCKIAFIQATEISPIIGVGQESFTFEVSDFGAGSKTVKFEPNIAGVLRLGVNAFGFGLGYSFRGPDKDTNPLNGKTQFSDWQLGYNSNNWGIEGFYQTYDGFYTANTSAVQTYPNLSFKHYGLTTRYALEDSAFTVDGLMNQADEIKQTTGKVYVVFAMDQHQMLTDTSLLQNEYAGINTTIENLRSLKSDAVKFGVGGGKYWVSDERLFIGGLADLMSTYANYKYESTTGNSTDSDFTTSFNLKLSAGYSTPHFRTGISIAGDITTLKAGGQGNLKASANRVLIYIRTAFNF